MGFRATRERVVELLVGDRPRGEVVAALAPLPRSQVLKALFAALCHHDPQLHWRAVSVMGPVVAALADHDLEAARVVMRRFMWSLNDESGGIGWGIPEAMGECLAQHEQLAEEYSHILVSFMREDGFYLEYPPLQQGLMWGLGRLAEVRPRLLRRRGAHRYLPSYLDSPDPVVCGLAARALGLLAEPVALPRLLELVGRAEPVRLYQDDKFLDTTTGRLAEEALLRLAPSPRSAGIDKIS